MSEIDEKTKAHERRMISAAEAVRRMTDDERRIATGAAEQLVRIKELGAAKLTEAGIPLPACCKTCAFRPGSVPSQHMPTLADALKCVFEKHQFGCHTGMKDGLPTRHCAGWLMTQAELIDQPIIKMPWQYTDEAKTNG